MNHFRAISAQEHDDTRNVFRLRPLREICLGHCFPVGLRINDAWGEPSSHGFQYPSAYAGFLVIRIRALEALFPLDTGNNSLVQRRRMLLLVVHGRAFKVSALGIGSARGHRPALPVVGYDNPARSRNFRALFHCEI